MVTCTREAGIVSLPILSRRLNRQSQSSTTPAKDGVRPFRMLTIWRGNAGAQQRQAVYRWLHDETWETLAYFGPNSGGAPAGRYVKSGRAITFLRTTKTLSGSCPYLRLNRVPGPSCEKAAPCALRYFCRRVWIADGPNARFRKL